MKKRRNAWILTFSGILLILSCVVLGKGLIVEYSRLNGSYSLQKVLVSVKNQIDPQGKNSFSADDIKRLKKELSTKDISYTVQSGLVVTSVSDSSTALSVRLTGVDSAYPLFNDLTMEAGNFITQKQEEEGALVAVIDDELARQMFKTTKVEGLTLEIFGGVFRIIGVVKKNDTLIGTLTDDGLPDVYIPAAVMLELDTTASIAHLQIRTAEAGTSDRYTYKISSALQQIGKNPSNYNITDYNLKYALMEQQPLLLVFIPGIVSIITLLVYVKELMQALYFLIKDGCRTDYFSNVIKCNLAAIGTCMLEITLSLLGVTLIWLGIRFKLYIPPKYIPDELINISYYSDLIKGIIQDHMQNLGYAAPHTELITSTINMLMNFFYSAMVLGSFLLYSGLREFKAFNMDPSRATLIFGLIFVLSLGTIAAIAYWANLPYILDGKGILVAWAFIYINIIIKRKESGVQNV